MSVYSADNQHTWERISQATKNLAESAYILIRHVTLLNDTFPMANTHTAQNRWKHPVTHS